MSNNTNDQGYRNNGSHHIPALLCACFAGAAALYLMPPDDPLVGTEDLNALVPFSKIEEQGDPRIKRVMSEMRKSKEGEALYQFAASNGLFFQWSRMKGQIGGYSNEHKTVAAAADAKDVNVIYTLVHELNHGWQDIALQPHKYMRGPELSWQIPRLYEVGACAYAAHYIATYQDQTGVALKVPSDVFGGVTAYKYAKIPASKRDYIRDAVRPCFDEIRNSKPYAQMHFNQAYEKYQMGVVAHKLTNLKTKMAEITETPYQADGTMADFIPVGDEEKAQLMASFFTPSLDVKDIPAEIHPRNPAQILSLVAMEAKPKSPAMRKDIKEMQEAFEVMRADAADIETRAFARNKTLKQGPATP